MIDPVGIDVRDLDKSKAFRAAPAEAARLPHYDADTF